MRCNSSNNASRTNETNAFVRDSATAIVCLLLVSGCGQQYAHPPTGGDTPIDISRLRGSTLKEIGHVERARLSWVFGDSTVEITYKGGAIPTPVVKDILGDASTPSKIVASWELIGDNKQLRLFEINVDGEKSDRETTLPISPAGHVRVSICSQQYNMFPPGRDTE